MAPYPERLGQEHESTGAGYVVAQPTIEDADGVAEVLEHITARQLPRRVSRGKLVDELVE